LALLKASVEVNDWETADLIVNWEFGGRVDLTVSGGVLEVMFKALNWLIEPWWEKVRSGVLGERFRGESKFRVRRSVNTYGDGLGKGIS
jgi:hypothetical protein